MIANPKDVPVEVLSGADIKEKTVSVIVGSWNPIEFELWNWPFQDHNDERAVAASTSARSLVRWAFDRGAFAVRSDYDLRLEK